MDFRIVPGSLERIRLAFAFLFMAGGLGLCGVYGAAWLQVPHYTDAQIATLAQIQVINQIARDPQAAPQDKTAADRQLAQARTRVEQRLEKRRKTLLGGWAAGFILIIAGFWQWRASRSSHSG